MVRIEADRGLTLPECRDLVEAPRVLPTNATKFQIWRASRDELVIRLLYESWARVRELIMVDVKDVDFDNCSILVRHPKGRAVFQIHEGRRIHVDTVHRQRQVFFSDYTRDLMIRYLQRRKRGSLIANSRKKRLSTRQAERVVDRHARSAGIQRVVGYNKKGREIRLVTCKALREAGERHTDVAGADRDATARIAGHTVQTKERFYKKGNYEEDRRIVRENHPLMREDGMGNRK
ncbi:MAG: tyrosine-type recombinase/integrase [Thermoplasmata archaeon]|nr:tyrosine-type recombinase/integrase [Thermoplasmata archaeon]